MPENDKIKNYHAKLGLSSLLRGYVRSSDDDHNMELVDEIRGIAFINDSRSIRLTATRNSLESVDAPVVLIAGGDDGINDYSIISQQVKQKVVAIIYLGTCSGKILKHFSSHYMLFAKAQDIKEAVQIANAYSNPGDVVLFSPACPGDHTVDNYKSRGNEFKAIVKELKG
jgi:UDP-N-acetylmuramoylalanine--D-glutamate ligase